MNTAPTDELGERLTERMQRLADDISVPTASTEADLARGRRRLRRQRLATIGGGVATLAVIGVAGALTVGTTGNGTSAQQVRPAAGGADRGAHASGKQQAAKEREARRLLDKREALRLVEGRHRATNARVQQLRAALADGLAGLEGRGGHLDATSVNAQGTTGGRAKTPELSGERTDVTSVGTKVGWRAGGGEGMFMVDVARDTAAVGGSLPFSCAPGETGGHPCTPVSLPDGTTGKQQSYRQPGYGDLLVVYYTRPDGQVVLVAESTLFGNDSTTPIAQLPATPEQLLRIATDARLTLDG